MTVRHARPRWAVLALAAFLTAACGSTATPPTPGAAAATGTGAPATGTAGSAGTPTQLADPSAPVIAGPDLAGSMATAEIAMRREDRERARVVDLGPGASDLVLAMDLSSGRALERAKTGAEASGASVDRRIAAVGPFAGAPQPGFNSMVVWALLITSLDGFAKGQADNGTVEEPAETVEIGSNTGTINTSLTLKAVTSGSHLSVDITIKTKGQVVDKATGAVLYAIDSVATGRVEIDFCPDAGGKAAATVKLTSSEVYTSGGSTKGTSKEFSGTVSIAVDDEANISKVEGTSKGAEDSKGVDAGGGGAVAASTRTASDNIANNGTGGRLPGVAREIQFGGEGSTLEQQQRFWGGMTVFVETMVTAAAQEAEKLWKDGKCVELLVDPDGGDVSPDEVKEVTAKLKHKIDGTELDKPVVATLTGVQSLDPAGSKQPAPATVSYTAGPKQGDVGRIAFRSVSNRGIADKTVTFTVGGETLKVGLTGTMTTSLGGISYITTVSAPSIVVARQADGTYAGSGASTASITLPIGDCPNPYNQKGTMNLRATREGNVDPAKPAAWTLSWEAGVSSTSGFCVIQGQRVDMESFTGPEGPTVGFLFILGDVRIDAPGGTKKVNITKSVGPSSNKLAATVTTEIVKPAKP